MKSKLIGALFLLAALAVFILPYILLTPPAPSVKSRYQGWWLPNESSTYAPKIDMIFDVILWLTVAIFILVTLCLLWFLWKYRHRADNRKATYTHGNNKLEIIWTAIPAVILVFMAVFSNDLWSEIKYPGKFPRNADHIRIKPRQFQWDITYPGADKQFDTPDDINTINQLYLVKGEPVQIFLQAQDVIHSFFVPEFRIKQDAVPGMTTSVWITPTTETEPERPLEIGCAELCGLGHYRMKGFVTVTSRDSVESFLKSQMAQQ